jgi:glucose-1-phosphate thymidylyltransferase
MISCPEEIAYRMGYISKEQLCELGKKLGGNSYGDYILGVARDAFASNDIKERNVP